MRAVFRVTVFVTRVLVVAVLLAACGAPPEPAPTGPPEAPESNVPVSVAPPSAGPPAYPMPSGGLPAAGYPTPGLPTYPTPTLPTVTPTRTSPPPSPAPRCAHGPSPAQVIAVVSAQPGMPSGLTLDVKQGPFCAGTWQFTVLGEAGKSLDEVDPLLVVTTGRPSALTVVEAGDDVCSSHVEDAAPAGIRVLACGF
jgi:hypothetical protein